MTTAGALRMRRPYAALFHTVIQGKIDSPWNTMEFTGRSEPAGVSIAMVPPVAVSRPARMRSSVVFPQPDGPTMTKNSPGAMSTETWSMATRAPNDFCRSLIRIAGRAGCGRRSAGSPTARRLVALAVMISGIVPGNRPDHNSPWAQDMGSGYGLRNCNEFPPLAITGGLDRRRRAVLCRSAEEGPQRPCEWEGDSHGG